MYYIDVAVMMRVQKKSSGYVIVIHWFSRIYGSKQSESEDIARRRRLFMW